jgi:hypothetical protein
MRCLNIQAEITITKMGLLVMMMLEFTGEVSAKPLKKSNWLIATPDIAQTRKRHQSDRAGNCNRFAAISQKRIQAPTTRSTIKLLGPMGSGITVLAMM